MSTCRRKCCSVPLAEFLRKGAFARRICRTRGTTCLLQQLKLPPIHWQVFRYPLRRSQAQTKPYRCKHKQNGCGVCLRDVVRSVCCHVVFSQVLGTEHC